MFSRRQLLVTSSVGLAGTALGACTLFQKNADGSYGLSASVIATIQSAVQKVANYVPAVESIAATAASLFGPAYSGAVSLATAAINQVISALSNLVASPPKLGATTGTVYAKFGIAQPTSLLVGYTAKGVPVFAQ